jgi:hypothetical protein
LAAGEEELIPAAFVNRLLDGENPVRVSRLAGHARTSTTLDIYGHLQEA